ncbi:hypothetical protein [Alkalicoccus luteus]|uniref:hypothetical protein n=1 Tax=Alkalicoccus luteus TaxID=1237094 RepID=UPI00403397A5
MKYGLIFGAAFLVGLMIIFGTGSEIGFYIMAVLPFVVYPILISLAVWFLISLINLQKERNRYLAEIVRKLEKENT